MTQTNTYHRMAEQGGSARPADLALALSRAMSYEEVGIPFGMLGLVFMAMSVRGYFACTQLGNNHDGNAEVGSRDE